MVFELHFLKAGVLRTCVSIYIVCETHCFSAVPVCEASVMIAVSAEHRKEAIEAVAYAIDQVKSTATIWKKVCSSLGSRSPPFRARFNYA